MLRAQRDLARVPRMWPPARQVARQREEGWFNMSRPYNVVPKHSHDTHPGDGLFLLLMVLFVSYVLIQSLAASTSVADYAGCRIEYAPLSAKCVEFTPTPEMEGGPTAGAHDRASGLSEVARYGLTASSSTR